MQYEQFVVEGGDSADSNPIIDDRLNPEAQLLCALLWADQGAPAVAFISQEMRSSDFYNPTYGTIFTMICDAIREGMPHDATAINVRMAAKGAEIINQSVLIGLMGLGALPANLIFYAEQVVSLWYRRQYLNMAHELVTVAEVSDEHKLFAELVERGKNQRAAYCRRAEFLPAARAFVAPQEQGEDKS